VAAGKAARSSAIKPSLGKSPLNATVWDEPDDGNKNVQGKGKPGIYKGKWNCDSIEQQRYLALEVPAKRGRQNGIPLMDSKQGAGKEKISDGSKQQVHTVERNGPRRKLILAHPASNKRNQR